MGFVSAASNHGECVKQRHLCRRAKNIGFSFQRQIIKFLYRQEDLVIQQTQVQHRVSFDRHIFSMGILAIPEFEPSWFLKKVIVAQCFSDTIIYTIYIWNLFGEGELICGSFWTHEASLAELMGSTQKDHFFNQELIASTG